MSIQTERIGHVTLIGSNEKDVIDFYSGVLGMPLVLRQPNLDDLETLHLFFDVGHGSYLTFFVRDDRPSDPSPVPWAIGSTHHVAMDVTEEVFERALTGLREHDISHSRRVDRARFGRCTSGTTTACCWNCRPGRSRFPRGSRRARCWRARSSCVKRTAAATSRSNTCAKRWSKSSQRQARPSGRSPTC